MNYMHKEELFLRLIDKGTKGVAWIKTTNMTKTFWLKTSTVTNYYSIVALENDWNKHKIVINLKNENKLVKYSNSKLICVGHR